MAGQWVGWLCLRLECYPSSNSLSLLEILLVLLCWRSDKLVQRFLWFPILMFSWFNCITSHVNNALINLGVLCNVVHSDNIRTWWKWIMVDNLSSACFTLGSPQTHHYSTTYLTKAQNEDQDNQKLYGVFITAFALTLMNLGDCI